MQRSIVVVDFVGFTAKNTENEILAGIAGASVLIEAIEAFVVSVLTDMGISTQDSEVMDPNFPVLKYTGDGLILHFEDAARAVDFGVRLQQMSEAHNLALEKSEQPNKDLGYRVFRVGIATGEVLQVKLSTMSREDLAGSVIGDAARLEAACTPGGVLITDRTFEHLVEPHGFSAAFQVDGKRADGKRYTSHNRVVFQRGGEFAGKVPYWRIHPTTDSVVAKIEHRIRYQMPQLKGEWAKSLADALKTTPDAESLIRATLPIPGEPDWALKQLGRLKDCSGPDPGQWILELALLATCRQIDFSSLTPPQPSKDTAKRGAYVVCLPTTLAAVASMCIAGMTGFSVRLERNEGAYRVDIDPSLPVTNYRRSGLQQLYTQLYGQPPRQTLSVLGLEGALRVKLADALEKKRVLTIFMMAPDNDSVTWGAACEAMAESLNHLVVLSMGDDLRTTHPYTHLGDIQQRLEDILKQHMFEEGHA